MDIILPRTMTVDVSNEIASSLQTVLEDLDNVERAFIFVTTSIISKDLMFYFVI